jgi:hypothetical protein
MTTLNATFTPLNAFTMVWANAQSSAGSVIWPRNSASRQKNAGSSPTAGSTKSSRATGWSLPNSPTEVVHRPDDLAPVAAQKSPPSWRLLLARFCLSITRPSSGAADMAVLRGLAPALRSNWGAQRRGHGADDLSRSAFSVLSPRLASFRPRNTTRRCRHSWCSPVACLPRDHHPKLLGLPLSHSSARANSNTKGEEGRASAPLMANCRNSALR